jgi:hypothetical protein
MDASSNGQAELAELARQTTHRKLKMTPVDSQTAKALLLIAAMVREVKESLAHPALLQQKNVTRLQKVETEIETLITAKFLEGKETSR